MFGLGKQDKTSAAGGHLKEKWHNGTIPGLVVSFAILIVLRAPGYADKGFWRAVAELDLIVAGVLFGLLIIPDKEAKLLDRAQSNLQLSMIKAPEVVRALDKRAVITLVQDILAMHSRGEVAEFATRHGWHPILRAADEGWPLVPGTPNIPRWHIREDVLYAIDVSGPHSIAGVNLHAIGTTVRGRRALPHGEAWLSFARTLDAFRGEFRHRQCLNREIVDVPDEKVWNSLIDSGLLRASLEIEGEELRCETERVSPDLFRFRFSLASGNRGEVSRLVTSRFKFYGTSNADYFPVRFVNYFCVGQTTVRLRITDKSVTDLDAFVHFAGDIGLDPEKEGKVAEVDPQGNWRQLEVSTTYPSEARKVVLWPGSGVVFVWRRGSS